MVVRWLFYCIFIFILLPIIHTHAEINSARYAGLVMRVNDGHIIYQDSADELRYPASLTKMMTLYLLFDNLRQGQVNMHTKLPVSVHAARQPRSNLNLRSGTSITVRDAIHALIIHSANDVAVVVAEALGGNEANFVRQMNKRAEALGMENTYFVNPHGLHNPDQVTTAMDMAKLGLALRKHYPQYFSLFSKKSFNFKGRIIHTHNRVMNRYKWATGLKTGYIRASGFNVVTTTRHPTGELVAVVMGGNTARARDDHMIALLDHSYQRLAQTKATHHTPKHVQSNNSNEEATLVAYANDYTENTPARHHDTTSASPSRPDIFTPLQQQKVAAISSSIIEEPSTIPIKKAKTVAKHNKKHTLHAGHTKKSSKLVNKVTQRKSSNKVVASKAHKTKLAKSNKTKHKMLAHKRLSHHASTRNS